MPNAAHDASDKDTDHDFLELHDKDADNDALDMHERVIHSTLFVILTAIVCGLLV
jgi:hypothetical protein